MWYMNGTSFYSRFAPMRVRVPAKKVKRREEDVPLHLGSYFSGIIFCNRRLSANSYYGKLLVFILRRI